MHHDNLTSWTERVFKLLKEPAGTSSKWQCMREEKEPGVFLRWRLFNAVDPEQFFSLMKEYAKQAEKTLGNPGEWLDEKAPQSSFFNFDHAFQEAGEDQTIMQLHHKERDLLSERELLYVQKTNFPEGSEICFFGDYHGSIHSCLRNLWRLVAQGFIDTNFCIIKENFYIICLGDYIDRGWFGLEVLYTLLLLKLAPGNWEKVFLLKGNHETMNQSAWTESSTGLTLFGELEQKFGSTKGDHHSEQVDLISLNGQTYELSMLLLTVTLKWYTFLPFALFVGNGRNEYIQCSHGGIERGYDFKLIVTNDKAKKYQSLQGPCTPLHRTEEDRWHERDWSVHSGFNWSDFFQGRYRNDKDYCQEKTEYLYSPRGAGIVPSVQWTEQYLTQHPFIKGFFRGHQDLFYGFKMLYKQGQQPTEVDFLKQVEITEKKEGLDKVVDHYRHSEAQDNLESKRRYYTSDDPEGQARCDIIFNELYEKELKEIQEKYPTFFSIVANKAEYDYRKGPFHWRLVVSAQDQKNPQGFLVSNYFPVFTFTSAPFGRGLDGNLFPFDCYGILRLSGDYATWTLAVYEHLLSVDRDGKYVSISFAPGRKTKKDPLVISWLTEPVEKMVKC